MKQYDEKKIIDQIKTLDPYCGRDPYFDTLIPRRAAVVIPLMEKDGVYQVLFEVRSSQLELQPGDISFPGGHIEKEEDSDRAAVREACEELLLREDQIEVIRKLPLQTGPGGVIVTPFVGVLKEYRGTFDEKETDRVFTVPLSFFMQQEPAVCHAVDEVKLKDDFPHEKVGDGRGYHFLKTRHDFYFYEYESNVIWGFTAKLIAVLVRMLKNGG